MVLPFEGVTDGAAGIALLLGGLGSFALWTDSTTVTAGTISSGELRIVKPANPVTPGAWKFANGSTLSNTSTIVPGDTVTYTESFAVDAKGDNLRGKLTASVGEPKTQITGATVTTNFTVAGGATRDPANTNIYTFGPGTYTVSVTLTMTFDWTTPGLTGQNQTFAPGAVTVSLEQLPAA